MKHSNDNIPILRRHPRLLVAPVQKGGCSRQQDADRNSNAAQEDVRGELSVIETRNKWLNWIEFTLNKRTVLNDNRQVWPAERSGASKRI
jgi:hypothetical protein